MTPNAAERLRVEAEYAMDNGAGMNLTRYIGEKRLLADLLDKIPDLISLASSAMHEANNDGAEYDQAAELAAARDLLARAEEEIP